MSKRARKRRKPDPPSVAVWRQELVWVIQVLLRPQTVAEREALTKRRNELGKRIAHTLKDL